MDAFIKELAAQLGISEAEAQALWGQIQAGEGGDAVTDAARKAYRIALQNPDAVTTGEVRQLQRILGIAPLPASPGETAEIRRTALASPNPAQALSAGLAAPPTGGTDSLAEYQRQTRPGILGPEAPKRFELPGAPDDLQVLPFLQMLQPVPQVLSHPVLRPRFSLSQGSPETRYCSLICVRSEASISGTPSYLVTTPVTKMVLPL